MPFELTEYNPHTGTLRAWVRLPLLEQGFDSTFYLLYGDLASVPNNEPTDVWTNGFEGVWHLNGTARDSTLFARDGVQFGTTSTNGKIGTGIDFDGASYITMGDVLDLAADIPFTAW